MSPRRAGRITRLQAVLAVAVLCGCSAPATDNHSEAAATPSGAETSQVVEVPNDTRCSAPVDITAQTLETASTSAPAAMWGHGATGVLLLHQTDGDGMCGWVAAADTVSGFGADARFMAFDLCGYGQATCAGNESNQKSQIVAAVKHLRSSGAHEVVIMGASLGGYLAVHVGRAAGADAVVSLSGYGMAGEASFGKDLRNLGRPVLLAMSHDDGEARFGETERLAATTGADFAGFATGHGYTMLPEAIGEVEAWVSQAVSAAP